MSKIDRDALVTARISFESKRAKIASVVRTAASGGQVHDDE